MIIKTVASAETSKLLKEDGFRQTTMFSWVSIYKEKPFELLMGYNIDEHEWYCAPTTDELLLALPEIGIVIVKYKNVRGVRYSVGYTATIDNHHIHHESLPEALAQMWLWLKKEELI